MEAPGIDPGTSRMLSERSTIWATPPFFQIEHQPSIAQLVERWTVECPEYRYP